MPCSPGERVLIIDDVLATGGHGGGHGPAGCRVLGADVAGFGCIIELAFLGGRGKLDGPRHCFTTQL